MFDDKGYGTQYFAGNYPDSEMVVAASAGVWRIRTVQMRTAQAVLLRERERRRRLSDPNCACCDINGECLIDESNGCYGVAPS